MNNLLKKSVGKVTLISVITAILLVLSIVVTAIFGVNYAATLDDNKTFTVTVNRYFYDTKIAEAETVCETEFAAQGLDVLYKYDGVMSGDECELVYVFDSAADLATAKTNLKSAFATKTADGGEWAGSFIEVATGAETLQTRIPTAYTVRACIAIAVFAVLAFAYVAVRYRLHMGLVVCASTLVGAVMTTALVLLVRLPVTSSIYAVAALAALLSAVYTLFTLNKFRANAKEGNAELSTEDEVINAVACKKILGSTAALTVALVLVGAIATTAVRWFAISALVGVLVSALVGLCFAPALLLPLQKNAAAKAAARTKHGYVGAKKSETAEEPATVEAE